MERADGGWTAEVDDAEAAGGLDDVADVEHAATVDVAYAANAADLAPCYSGITINRERNLRETRNCRLGANPGAEPYSHVDCRP